MSPANDSAQPSGITLQAIGLTLIGGLCISFLSVIAFGVAVIARHTNIAPRCTTRHPNTIWRSKRDMYGDSNKKEPKRQTHIPAESSTRKRRGQSTKRMGQKPADETLSNSKHAPSIAATIATKLVTGPDLNGQKKEKEELVQNSIRQKVYVGVDPSRRSQESYSGGTMQANVAGTNMGNLCVDAGVPIKEPLTSMPDHELSTFILNKEDDLGPANEDSGENTHPQDRGNPFLGWIPWTLRLSYDRMLRGIPGTGTRERGMGGKLLGVNLDAIVLFRFHAVVCFICIGIILPLNITACEHPHCNANLTDYGRTTVANVVYNIIRDGSETSSGSITDKQKVNVFSTIFWTDQSLPHLLRLYAISICTWYITYFTLNNIKRDWRENLVLRRVYYLEADHYGSRQSELDRTVYRQCTAESKKESDSEDEGLCNERDIGKGRCKNREPWIPHPEHRDTVPSIELYSVLVGGLPSLPDEVVNSKDMQTALGFSKRASIDWQLAVATTFFDHCVPNQPGFSSSVVAVTILPGAPELAKAWRKWYSAAAALRRLRFIRQVIKDKRYYAIDDVDEESGAKSSNLKPSVTREINQSDFFLDVESRAKVTFLHHESAPQQSQNVETWRQVSPHREAYCTAGNSSDVDYRIFRSLNYGPEQQAVYSREMAQGAAACCPNGCCEGRVKRQPIDRLLEMEDATIIRLEKAQYELQCAQMQAAVSIVDGCDNLGKKPLREVNVGSEKSKSLGDESPPKRSSPGDPRIGVEGGDSMLTNIGGVEFQARGNIFQKESIIHVSPKTPVFAEQNSACEKLDREALPFPGTALPSIVHEATVEDDEMSAEENAAPQSNELFPHQNYGNLLPKRHFRQSNLHVKSPTHPVTRSTVLRMNSEGRFLFNNAKVVEDEEASKASRVQSAEPSLRRRANTGQSALSEGDVSKSSNQWNQVNSILRTCDAEDRNECNRNKREIETGVWQKPSFSLFMAAVKSDILSSLKAAGRWTKGKTDPLTSKLAKDSTYAVVTFSSRQAAVAARHCLADGRGVQRWLSVETVPVPPLADAAPCDIITCRGCCRPVTLNINHNQLMLRRYIALASLAFIYVFYTIPITAAQSLVAPQSLKETLPGFHEWMSQTTYLSAEIMSGLVSALLYTSFFALCPVMFKAIANSGSQATSVQEAEKYALQYYWYFMLVTAFVFTGLADAATNIWYHSFSNLEQSIEELIENIAAQTPLTTAATWLNWIIVRTTMTLPLQYLLQVNSFIFGCVGWKCCARCVMGGGPGGPIPYRIYVDGGVVFLCVVALAPQSPLVAPVALLYYLFCVPLWRRNCIFMYRPKFDSGGEHWPFLSDMLITSLFMGQFLLTLQMVLRDAFGPALIAAFPAVPTYLYRNFLIKRFRRAYDDAGLLQTSLLDGWDNTIPTSVEKREEFRQFLVDAHKAAYIPVCIAGGATNILTAEPALVIPSENDDMLGYADLTSSGISSELIDIPPSPYFGGQAYTAPSAVGTVNDLEGISTPTLSNQRGACMRRAVSFSAHTPRSTSSPSHPTDAKALVTVDRGSEPSRAAMLWQKGQDQFDVSLTDSVDPGCTQS